MAACTLVLPPTNCLMLRQNSPSCLPSMKRASKRSTFALRMKCLVVSRRVPATCWNLGSACSTTGQGHMPRCRCCSSREDSPARQPPLPGCAFCSCGMHLSEWNAPLCPVGSLRNCSALRYCHLVFTTVTVFFPALTHNILSYFSSYFPLPILRAGVYRDGTTPMDCESVHRKHRRWRVGVILRSTAGSSSSKSAICCLSPTVGAWRTISELDSRSAWECMFLRNRPWACVRFGTFGGCTLLVL